MTTASTDEAAVLAATQALATADLATMQAFYNTVTSGAITLGSFQAQLTALPNAIGDPGRQAAIQAILAAWQQQVVGAFDTLLSQATAVA